MLVTGDVTDTHARWTADGSRIITEATVQTDTGNVVVSQLGGTIDGIAMRTMPGPDLLQAGMRVTLDARFDFDLSLAPHVDVVGVKVLAYPPNYVRTGPTKSGHYLYWESSCVYVTADSAGTKEVVGDTEFPVIEQSMNTWSDGTVGCSYMNLMFDGKKSLEVGRDMVNLIKFRDTSWCRPATKDDPARCHPDSAAGITTATYVDDASSDRDGAIVDADVELNGVNFSIAVNGQTLGTEPCISELQNTLTHELGHLQGLEHTCLAPGDPPRVDNTGAQVPPCSSATATQLAATMYNFQECGETIKETLEPDDSSAICGIYPKASDPGSCEKVEEPGNCLNAVGGGQGLLLVGIVLLFCRRRR